MTTEVSTTPLAEQVRVVADARRREDAAKRIVEERRAQWEAENVEELAELTLAKIKRESAETACRALALAHFAETGEKKPTPGVEIKERTSINYAPEAALAWARETKIALVPETYDPKAFEKIAKVTPLPFVTITSEPSAQLASDLSAFATTEEPAS